jgi:hypothetical protein
MCLAHAPIFLVQVLLEWLFYQNHASGPCFDVLHLLGSQNTYKCMSRTAVFQTYLSEHVGFVWVPPASDKQASEYTRKIDARDHMHTTDSTGIHAGTRGYMADTCGHIPMDVSVCTHVETHVSACIRVYSVWYKCIRLESESPFHHAGSTTKLISGSSYMDLHLFACTH